MNKTQRWNYEDLQHRCDQIAALGRVIIDLADGALLQADPEDVMEVDINEADLILAHLLELLAFERVQTHCRKLGIDPTQDWEEIFENLPDLTTKPN